MKARIIGAGIVASGMMLVFAGCIIRTTPDPDPTPPPPPYGSNPYMEGGGSGTGGTETGGTPLTEEEAKQSIVNYMQSERVTKMTQGFDFLAEQWSPSRVEAGTDSATLRFEVAVEKGVCMRLIAVADPGIPKLDMYLYGDADSTVLLDRDIADDNYPVVSFCPSQDGSIFAETSAEAGAGWFLIHVWSKTDDGTVKRTMEVVEGSAP